MPSRTDAPLLRYVRLTTNGIGRRYDTQNTSFTLPRRSGRDFRDEPQHAVNSTVCGRLRPDR